jgi:hypothetical protein
MKTETKINFVGIGMKNKEAYKAICKCHACATSFEVEFLLPPSEEDKLGFYCNDCVQSERAKPCICDYLDGNATVVQRAAAEGHYNQAGGFCCPHHGNTCGHCLQYG